MKAIRHVGIVVKDLSRALYFYRDLLGFKIIKEKNESGDYINTICRIKVTAVTTVKLSADDNNLIELLYFTAPKSSEIQAKELTDLGFSHLACSVDNIEKEYKRLTKAGVNFNSPPQKSPDGYAKVAFCRDPEGNFIELVEVIGEK